MNIQNSVISVLSAKLSLVKDLQAVLPLAKIHFVENPDTDKQFRESHIIIADYPLLAPYLYELPNAKWIQGTWAGVDKLLQYVRPDQPPPFLITRFSGKHFGTLMSEYVIANIINRERAFFEIKENQNNSEWVTDGKISVHRTLNDLTIGILGLGNIGNRIAKNLNLLGAKIIGFGRSSSLEAAEKRHISEYYVKPNLAEFLQKCDYFVNVLPSTPETQKLLNGNILENCTAKNTVFVNIGRGTIISEECLVEALKKKWLAGAILDVHEEEPLKKGSALWSMKNVFISPHISGRVRTKDVVEHFVENYKLYEQNLPVSPLIDFNKGY